MHHWDSETGAQLQAFKLGKVQGRAPIFSADARWVATGGYRIGIWETATGRATVMLPVSGVPLAFTADGRLATTDENGSVRIWDVATGKIVNELIGQETAVKAAAFSPDSRWLASGGADTSVLLWKVPGD